MEPPTDAQTCSCIMLLCLGSHCLIPQDVFPIQSVRQTHFQMFNLKAAAPLKPLQAASPQPLGELTSFSLGLCRAWTLPAMTLFVAPGEGRTLIPVHVVVLYGYHYLQILWLWPN